MSFISIILRNSKKVDQTRPKNLNLFTIRFPLPAIASILHRISGFVLFLLIPVVLWSLDFSLTAQGFDTISEWLSTLWGKFLTWVILAPFCYHLVAGIRHLLSDLHLGNTRRGGKITALAVFVISTILIVSVGIWLW